MDILGEFLLDPSDSWDASSILIEVLITLDLTDEIKGVSAISEGDDT